MVKNHVVVYGCGVGGAGGSVKQENEWARSQMEKRVANASTYIPY